MRYLDDVRWNADGLVPSVAQSAGTGRVLTLAWMNRAALSATIASGYAHYWSRSRRKLWKKGETSGHVQAVREVRLDCDGDAILLIVDQEGGIACHTGHERCFFNRLEEGEWRDAEPIVKDPALIYGRAQPAIQPRAAAFEGDTALAAIAATIEARKGADPGASYVASLLARGEDAILKKIGEEATETVLAAKGGDPVRITHEVADLWFHCLVMLSRHGLSPEHVLAELARRHGTSGIDEKAARPPPACPRHGAASRHDRWRSRRTPGKRRRTWQTRSSRGPTRATPSPRSSCSSVCTTSSTGSQGASFTVTGPRCQWRRRRCSTRRTSGCPGATSYSPTRPASWAMPRARCGG